MKQYKTGVMVGRFQPIHIGHCASIDVARALCEKVYIFVGSAQESGTLANPFEFTTRARLIEAIYPTGDVIVVPLNDLTETRDATHSWGTYLVGEFIKTLGAMPDLMVYGNEECRSHWFTKEQLANTSEFIANRNQIDISATDIRYMILTGEEDGFKRWTHPALHPYYEQLRLKLHKR